MWVTAHEFDVLEFLALLSTHIAKPYESLTRYYGFWSCRTRGERKKLAPVPELQPITEPPSKPSSAWARCIKQIYEINPLECPRCKNTLRIVAFIEDAQAIKDIMKSLGLPDFRAPPPLPIPPPLYEHLVDSIPDYNA